MEAAASIDTNRALEIVSTIMDRDTKQDALMAVASAIATRDLDLALKIAHMVEGPNRRAVALASIAEIVATTDLVRALEIARTIVNPDVRVRAFSAIIRHAAPTDFFRAWGILNTIDDARSRAAVLRVLRGDANFCGYFDARGKYYGLSGQSADLGQRVISELSHTTQPFSDTLKEEEIVISRIELQIPGAEHSFTPAAMVALIRPYFSALASVQHIIDDVLGREPPDVQILHISSGSVWADILGAADSIRGKFVIRRKNTHLLMNYLLPVVPTSFDQNHLKL